MSEAPTRVFFGRYNEGLEHEMIGELQERVSRRLRYLPSNESSAIDLFDRAFHYRPVVLRAGQHTVTLLDTP